MSRGSFTWGLIHRLNLRLFLIVFYAVGVNVVGINRQNKPSCTREGFSATVNFSLIAPELQNSDSGQRCCDPGAQGESRLLGG